jgi:hypothetical protein
MIRELGPAVEGYAERRGQRREVRAVAGLEPRGRPRVNVAQAAEGFVLRGRTGREKLGVGVAQHHGAPDGA